MHSFAHFENVCVLPASHTGIASVSPATPSPLLQKLTCRGRGFDVGMPMHGVICPKQFGSKGIENNWAPKLIDFVCIC